LKVKPGQKWDYEFHHGPKLRFRQIGKKGKVGAWRKVGKNIWYDIGEGSGLPLNLFHPLQEAILDSAMKITREKRTFRYVRKPLVRGLSAGATLIGCEMVVEDKKYIRFVRKQKPSMDFAFIDFGRHSPSEFFQKDKHHNVVKNSKGLPKRALGKLADVLRKRRPKTLKRLEQKSSAILRWLIVVFAPSPYAERNVWLVPAKSRKGGD
jgi:hypothetical protein